MPTIRDVARLAGVSAGTVSNVLNRPSSVSAGTRRKVEAAIAQLGFTPRESSRQFRAGRSRAVGMIVVDVANPFFVDLALGAEMFLRESDTALVLCNSAEDPVREEQNLDLLVQLKVQGVLIAPVDEANPRLRHLSERGVPVVFLDRIAGRATRCSVAVDDVLGGRTATAHLLALGHRRIGFVGGPATFPQVSDRVLGARAALAGTGAVLTVFETRSVTVEEGRRVGREIAVLPATIRPTAVFCANDLLAIGLLQELLGHRLRVPQDIALVGYDDLSWAGSAAVPLTSIRQPRETIGRLAARLLVDEIERPGAHRHEQILLEPELIVRRSSGPARPVAPDLPARRG